MTTPSSENNDPQENKRKGLSRGEKYLLRFIMGLWFFSAMPVLGVLAVSIWSILIIFTSGYLENTGGLNTVFFKLATIFAFLMISGLALHSLALWLKALWKAHSKAPTPMILPDDLRSYGFFPKIKKRVLLFINRRPQNPLILFLLFLFVMDIIFLPQKFPGSSLLGIFSASFLITTSVLIGIIFPVVLVFGIWKILLKSYFISDNNAFAGGALTVALLVMLVGCVFLGPFSWYHIGVKSIPFKIIERHDLADFSLDEIHNEMVLAASIFDSSGTASASSSSVEENKRVKESLMNVARAESADWTQSNLGISSHQTNEISAFETPSYGTNEQECLTSLTDSPQNQYVLNSQGQYVLRRIISDKSEVGKVRTAIQKKFRLSEDDSNDLTMEALISVCTSNNLDNYNNLGAVLMTAARNNAVDFLEKRGKLGDIGENPWPSCPFANTDDIRLETEVRTMRKSFYRLDIKTQKALWMKASGYSHREIAKYLKISERNSRDLVGNGLKKLRRDFEYCYSSQVLH